MKGGKRMLKKLVLAILLFQFSTMGLHTGHAAADEMVAADADSAGYTEATIPSDSPEGVVDVELSQTSTLAEEPIGSPEQQNESTAGQDQVAPSDAGQDKPATSEQKDAVSEDTMDQNQSTDTYGNQSQDVNGEAEVVQNQMANDAVCQEQSVSASVSCNDKLDSDVNGDLDQSQITKIEAGQLQSGVSSGKVDADQKQEIDVTSGQTQEVTLPLGDPLSQNQGTNASTSQSQSISAEEQAVFLQEQLTGVGINQRQQLSASETKVDDQKQQTTIEALQNQYLSTSGSAKVEQTQTAEVKSKVVDTLKKIVETGVSVTTRNYVEIVKDSVSSMVKVFQEIVVNNELVDLYYHQFKLDGTEISDAPQHKYEKQFDWGNLVVENSAMVHFNEELQSFETTMSSFLGITFFVNLFNNDDKPDSNNGGDPVTPPPGENENPPQGGDNGGDPVTPPPGENENPPPGGDNGGDPVTPPPGENENPTQGGDNGGDPVTPPPGENENPPQDSDNGGDVVTSPPVENGQVSSPTTETEVQKPAESKPENVIYTAAVSDKANSLPITASNTYNYLILGLLLVTAGSVFVLIRRKRV